MKIETFKIAKNLMDSINHFKVKKLQIEQIRPRENDEDFNLCRQLAFDGIVYAIDKLETEFQLLS